MLISTCNILSVKKLILQYTDYCIYVPNIACGLQMVDLNEALFYQVDILICAF